MSPTITLKQVLDLVGTLDDSTGEHTSRERFRRFLQENVKDIGQIRDYVEECLRNKGAQYNFALQDLVNHIGQFLDFQVTYGRYRGSPKQIGFDGLWKSPSGFNIIVEVKTTEVHNVRTSKLLGYMNELISIKEIADQDTALGLYVVGRPDPDIHQLENSIIVENRINELRTISVQSLLSLAELMNEYDITHDDILSIIRPSGPNVDPIIELIARLTAQGPEPEGPDDDNGKSVQVELKGEATYWLTPVRSDEVQTAEQIIQTLIGEEHIYAFGERTPGRKDLKPGDALAFYASGNGIIAHATVFSEPEKKPHPKIHHPEKYPWTFRIGQPKLYITNPVIIDRELRNELDAFKERDPDRPWGWFVQSTRRVSKHDFDVLTKQSS